MTIEHFACALLWNVWNLFFSDEFGGWKITFPPRATSVHVFPILSRGPRRVREFHSQKKECIHTNEAKSKLKNWRLKCPSRPSEAIKREEKKSCKRNFILKLRLLLSNSDRLRGCAWTWNSDLFVCACADIAEMRSRGLRCFAPHSKPNSNMRFTPFVYHSEAHFPLSFAFFLLCSHCCDYIWSFQHPPFAFCPCLYRFFFLLQRIQTCSQSIDKHRRTHTHKQQQQPSMLQCLRSRESLELSAGLLCLKSRRRRREETQRQRRIFFMCCCCSLLFHILLSFIRLVFFFILPEKIKKHNIPASQAENWKC